MKNKYGLLEEKLIKIRKRDKRCVYCHEKMTDPILGENRKNWATIEHLNHLPPWNNIFTVTICCGGCNSRRGKRKITEWFKGKYCIEKNINDKTVSNSVKEYIKKYEQ